MAKQKWKRPRDDVGDEVRSLRILQCLRLGGSVFLHTVICFAQLVFTLNGCVFLRTV